MSSTPACHQPASRLGSAIAGVVLRLTPACREAARLASAEREHPLPFATRTRLGLHRHFCPYCARYATQLDLLRDAARVMPEHLDELTGPGLKADARTRLKRALREKASG
jgi:hypothetical protein